MQNQTSLETSKNQFVFPMEPRTTILVYGRDDSDLVPEIVDAIVSANKRRLEDSFPVVPPMLDMHGYPVFLTYDKHGYRLKCVDSSGIVTVMDATVDFDFRTGVKDAQAEERTGLVDDIGDEVLRKVTERLPKIYSSVNTPVFSSKGSLLSWPGLYEEERLWIDPHQCGYATGPMGTTQAEIDDARSYLLEALRCEWFGSVQDQVRMLAVMMQPFARRMIDGPLPFQVIASKDRVSEFFRIHDLPTIYCSRDEKGSCILHGLPDYVTKGQRIFHPRVLRQDTVCEIGDGTPEEPRRQEPLETWILNDDQEVRLSGGNTLIVNMVRWERGLDQSDHSDWSTKHGSHSTYCMLLLIQAWVNAGRPSGYYPGRLYREWGLTMSGILEVAGLIREEGIDRETLLELR